MSERKQLSGAAKRKARREREVAERRADAERREQTVSRGESPVHRYLALLARRPSSVAGLAAWMAETLGEAVAEVLGDEVMTADDRRRWLRDLGRTFAAVSPKSANDAAIQRLERVAKLAPAEAAAELDRDPGALTAAQVDTAPSADGPDVPAPPITGSGELEPDPEAAA